jgi:hypothetical protein
MHASLSYPPTPPPHPEGSQVRIAAANRRNKDILNLFVPCCVATLLTCPFDREAAHTCADGAPGGVVPAPPPLPPVPPPPFRPPLQTPRPIENLFVTLTPVGRTESECSMTVTWDYPYLIGNPDADIVDKFIVLTAPFVGKRVRVIVL